MNDYRFILDTKSKKFLCPECNKRTLVKYIDMGTGEYLPDHYGRCDREIKCNYHLNPYKDGYYKMIWEQENEHGANFQRKQLTPYRPQLKQEIKQPSLIESDILKSSLKGYEENIFIKYILKKFGKKITEKVIEKYFIGTSKHWSGATIFWQIDIPGKIKTGKIMLYDQNLHRVKEPFNHITWVQTVLKIENFNLKQCLYGEHLLKGNTMSVAIVESEKTAIIASIYFPQFIWLSCGNLQGLNIEKCKVLSGRNVCLFPDINAYEKWSTKAKELEKQMPGTTFNPTCKF